MLLIDGRLASAMAISNSVRKMSTTLLTPSAPPTASQALFRYQISFSAN
jgi:hypothetical protein